MDRIRGEGGMVAGTLDRHHGTSLFTQADSPLLLAPMVGLSNRPLRTLVAGFGPPEYQFTEMASAGGYVSGAPHESCYLDPRPSPGSTSVQFNTTRREHLGTACRKLATVPGPERPAGIDLNFACSAPHITRSGGGSAWMTRPEEAIELAGLARASWDGLLSVKIRTGRDDDRARLLEFCLGLSGAGVDFITIHPRLDSQKFRGKPRLDHIAFLVGHLDIPVVGNGDVRSWKDRQAMIDLAGPAGVMIGREAVRRPWIFALLRGADADPRFALDVDRLGTALRFLDLVDDMLPPEWRRRSARDFFGYFCDTFTYAHHVRRLIGGAEDTVRMRAILDDYFREVPGDRRVLDRAVD